MVLVILDDKLVIWVFLLYKILYLFIRRYVDIIFVLILYFFDFGRVKCKLYMC